MARRAGDEEVITEFRMFEILDKLQNTATGLDVPPAWFLRLGAPVFCIIQASAIGPASYVVNAADLTTVTAGNLIVKYADDTYLSLIHI